MIAQYEQLAQEQAAGFKAFAQTYELMHPRPKPAATRWFHVIGRNMTKAGLFVVFCASVVVSGSRTLVEFGGGIVGAAALAMLELALFIFAFVRTSRKFAARLTGQATAQPVARRDAKPQKTPDQIIGRLLTWGIAFITLTMILANVDVVLSNEGIHLPEWFDLMINGAVAVSAPVLAFISGDVLGMLAVRDQQARKAEDDAYQTALAQWQQGLNDAWTAARVNYGFSAKAVQAKLGVSAVLSEQTDRQTGGQGREVPAASGFTRTAGGQQRVIDWLDAHPEDAALSVRPLAEKVGVGHDTAAKGKKAWMAQQDSEVQS